MNKRVNFIGIFLSVILFGNYAQAQQATISGFVKDSLTGETLIGANIFLAADPNVGTVSNTYGFYSITLPAGEQLLSFSYVGFQRRDIGLSVAQSTTLN